MEKFNWKLTLFGICFTWLMSIVLLPKITFNEYAIISTIFSVAIVAIVNIQWIKENLKQ